MLLQRGSMEDNALAEPHTLTHGHPLPNGDIGAQHCRRGHLSCWVDINVSSDSWTPGGVLGQAFWVRELVLAQVEAGGIER